MRARYIKFVIWVVALVAVWNLGQSYTITNSIFLFAAAGVVPGTDITLAPNEVLFLLGTLLVFSVLLIFSTNIGRRGRAMFRNAAHDVALGIEAAETADAVQLISRDAAVAAPKTKAKGKKTKAAKAPKPKTILVIKPQKRPSRIMVFVYVAWGAVAPWLRARAARLAVAARAATNTVVRGYNAVRAAARRTGLRVRAAIIRTVIVICLNAIRFWHWLEPYLRAFDAWLGAQYHSFLGQAKREAKRNETIKILLGFVREAGKIFSGARAEIRAVWARVAEK